MDVAVVSAARTPVGRAVRGRLAGARPDDLAARVIDEAVRRTPGLSPVDVDDVILGCAFPEGPQGFNVARNAIFLAGWPHSVPGQTVNRLCASGLEAIVVGARAIALDEADVIVAGGVESMSMLKLDRTLEGQNPTLFARVPAAYMPMPLTVERLVKRFGISREVQDEFAHASHVKAAAAQSTGRFDEELMPIAPLFSDECIRIDSSLDTLRSLKPAFMEGGSLTEGNSCPMSDGAAAVTLVSRAKKEQLGLAALGRIRAFSVAGVEPELMGTGPVRAIRALLDACELQIEAIDLFEINEAFAGQAAWCQRELSIPDAKLNVNGGAIALGHPLGATGAKLAGTLLFEMRRRNARFGVVSMCVGGGMGVAALFEGEGAW
jgi:acetyl-CoA acyltransferase